ncbi:MAG: hypothetical protein VKL01_00380 [Limnothrix sp.]|uniref:Sgl0002 protein n=1 Tax=Limnothrix redekei LRLZ20PSL1 TaxID=3112953 RepID=A0ABW7CAT1_9CYAN|nr:MULTISPECIES: hypothetical protein [unclassified Limnothrix]MEB3116791.1 hypothetical protein [Limnothrix sp.]
METSALTVLSIVAMGLMVVVTGGIVYLTAAEWRDRRRQKTPQKR